MSSSIDTIGHKLQTLEERLQAENESRDCMVLPSQMPGPRQSRGPRPQHLGEITPTRPKKPLNLPVIQPPQAVETETDRKLKKIMKQNGILTINGLSYQSDIKDLEHIGDLGNGTSGHVVKMRHIPSGAIIAVKQMRRTGNSEENKRILMDLDVVLKSHDCKYIVQCLGCFITDLDVWICMELMTMCFDKLLKLSKMPVPEPILGKVTVATVKALSYLKEKQDVIHRDVKPSNILIDERGNIKLCDFGISGRLVDSKANTRSAGCAAYMAPERIDPKKPKYDIRADVWSLGITLVELATACSPYEGCKTDFEVLTKVLDSDPPSLPKDQGFSQEFQDFVSKCLKKNHTFRPKYPELLEQPFIKIYETKIIDVPAWFRSVVEMAGIKPHRRIPSPSEITTSTTSTQQLLSTTSALNNRFGSIKASHIPNYQLNKTTALQNQNIQQQLIQQQQQQHHQQQQQQQQQQQPQQHPAQCQTNKNLITGYQKLQSQSTSSSSASSSLSSSTSSSLPQPITKTYAYQPLPKETNGYTQSILKTNNGYQGDEVDIVGEMNKLYKKSPFVQKKLDNNTNKTINYGESPKKESVLSSLGQSLIRNITTSPFGQKKIQNQPEGFWKFSNPPDGGGGGGVHNFNDRNKDDRSASPSPIVGRKRFQTTVPVINDSASQYARLPGNTSPIVLQRFYHQQNQLREKELEKQKQQQQQHHHHHLQQQQQQQQQQQHHEISTNPFLNSFIPKYNHHNVNNQAFSQISSQNISDSDGSSNNHHQYPHHHHHHHHTASTPQCQSPSRSNQASSNIPIYCQQQLNSGTSSGYGVQNVYSNNLYGRTMTQQQQQQQHQHQQQQQSANREGNIKDEQGWFNSIAGVVKKQFASYVKLHLAAGDKERDRDRDRSDINRSQNYRTNLTTANMAGTSTVTATANNSNSIILSTASFNTLTTATNVTTTMATSSKDTISDNTCNIGLLNNGRNNQQQQQQQQQQHQQYHYNHPLPIQSSSSPHHHHHHHPLSGIDRRHRSPDPPPRYNRGQSPLLLRKNLLELTGQPPGSPLLSRRYTTASPPLPPPRRGSESVPGSPQHFRTRIHYTPEPQRRIYRTIDQ